MSNLLSKFLKQKKIIIFIVLILTTGALFFPKTSLAAPICASAEPGTFWYNYCYYYYGNFGVDITEEGIPPGIFDNIVSNFGPDILGFLTALIYWSALGTVYVLGTLSNLSAKLLTNIIAMDFGCLACANNLIVAKGWAIVRDLANMFVVLGFVIIGISTILRIRDYEAKKLLPTLIIVALLINFSLLICGVFIDGSNIFAKHFNESGFFSMSWKQSLESQLKVLSNEYKGNGSLEEALGVLGAATGLAFYNIMAIIIFLLYFFLYLFRFIALSVLVTLSPLAFVCYAFPFSKNIWNMWWSNFFQWCIILVPVSFFVWIASSLISGIGEVSGGVDVITPLSFLIPGCIMLVGFLFSLKISAMGAGAAIKGFKWSGGKIMGATGGTLKGLANKTGASRAATGAKDMATRGLEGMGLIKPGATTANQQARLAEKDRQNRVNSMSAEQMVREIQSPRRGNQAHYDRAAMVKRLATDGKLDLLPAEVRDRAIRDAMSFGVSGKELITSMQSGDVAAILNDENNRQFNPEARAEGFKALSKRGDLDLIQGANNRQRELNNAVQHGARIEEIEKADYHYGGQNTARLDRIAQSNFGGRNFDQLTAAEQTTARENAIEQTLDATISSMSHEQLRNIDERHLTARRVDRFTPDKINAFQFATQDRRDAIHDHFAVGGQLDIDWQNAWNEYDAAVTAGDTARANNRYAEFRRLNSLRGVALSLP